MTKSLRNASLILDTSMHSIPQALRISHSVTTHSGRWARIRAHHWQRFYPWMYRCSVRRDKKIHGHWTYTKKDGQPDDRFKHRQIGWVELLYTCLSNFVPEVPKDGNNALLNGLNDYNNPDNRNRIIYHDRPTIQSEKLQKIIDDAVSFLPKCKKSMNTLMTISCFWG